MPAQWATTWWFSAANQHGFGNEPSDFSGKQSQKLDASGSFPHSLLITSQNDSEKWEAYKTLSKLGVVNIA